MQILKFDTCPKCGCEFKRLKTFSWRLHKFRPVFNCPSCKVRLVASYPRKVLAKGLFAPYLFLVLAVITAVVIIKIMGLEGGSGLIFLIAVALLGFVGNIIYIRSIAHKLKNIDNNNILIEIE